MISPELIVFDKGLELELSIDNLSKKEEREIEEYYKELEKGLYEEFFKKLASAAQYGFILDLGCGFGQWLVGISRLSPTFMIGGDIRFRHLSIAREIFEQRKLNHVAVVTLDGMALPFRNHSFDLIICRGLLPYVKDDFRLLRELVRVLKPSGQFLIRFQLWGYYIHMFIQEKSLGRKFYRMKSLVSSLLYHLTGRKWFQDTFQLSWRLKKQMRDMGIKIDKKIISRYGLLPGFEDMICSFSNHNNEVSQLK